DGGRNRLEHGHARFYARAAQQNGLERLGNTVSADLLRAVVADKADNQSADDRHSQHPPSQMIAGGRNRLRAPALIEKYLREEIDELQQSQSDISGHHADAYGDERHRDDADSGGEITQPARGFVVADAGTKSAPERNRGSS